MPLYRYECDTCHERFDDLRKVDERDEPAECPECGESGHRLLAGYSVSAGGAAAASTPSCTTGGG